MHCDAFARQKAAQHLPGASRRSHQCMGLPTAHTQTWEAHTALSQFGPLVQVEQPSSAATNKSLPEVYDTSSSPPALFVGQDNFISSQQH